MDQTQKEYIITLKSRDDLDGFYQDIESPSGKLYIPNRAVQCAKRRKSSRNTHYMLTDQEAQTIRKDPRVLSVERRPEDIGIVPIRYFEQTESTWDKSATNNSSHKNWGLLRCVEGQNRPGWGSDSTPSATGTIHVTAEGRHVDVVIVDGMIDPAHPELAVNSDGSGGSRVVQYNWFQHDLGQSSSTYVYEPYVDPSNQDRSSDNDHGAHVAGTVAGNSQGWARQANIYNINPYGTDVNQVEYSVVIDYIREFHNSKPINPITGRRNPTICNHSWGFGSAFPIDEITSVTFRGSSFSGPFTGSQLASYGIRTRMINGTEHAIRPARVAAIDADMEDAVLDGIIMVGAAGNDGTKIDMPGGTDFNNFFIWNGFSVPYHRGSSPGSSANCICVGAIGSLADDSKVSFSNAGPRVDILAPGTNIKSNFNGNSIHNTAPDPRDSSFYIGKISGTSMASPQVCGVLACALETYPNMTQSQAIEYITTLAGQDQVADTGNEISDELSLQGGPNRYLRYRAERSHEGAVSPKINTWLRPSAGTVWPRIRRRIG